MVGRAIESKTLIKTNDRQRQPYINSQRMAQMGILSTMCAPLRVENQIIGTLNVGLKQLNAYSAEHERLMIQIASLLGTTLENRQLLSQMGQNLAETQKTKAALSKALDAAAAQAERLELLNQLVVGLSQARTRKPFRWLPPIPNKSPRANG
jgi:GAF domain-containing protein